MRRLRVVVCLLLAGLVVTTTGCGSSSAVTGADEPVTVARGSSVLHGSVQAPGLGAASAGPGLGADSGASGWVVSIAGTSVSAELDDDGRFVLTSVPSGTVTVKIDGPGLSVQVPVSGLQDGQVTSVEILVTGGAAQLVTTPQCAPSAETYFSGSLDKAAGTQLVVGGRSVDASQVKVVWRGSRRIQLSDLEAGEKVKVWGTLRGDGVVVAEEIQALTSGAQTWVTFSGRVDHVSSGFAPGFVEANPYPTPTYYPTLVVKGITVKTSPETKVRRADGGDMLACDIKVGQSASVEGWKQTDGTVKAGRIVIQ